MRASDVGKQFSVNFADQADRDGKILKPRKAVVHCPDIVDDFVKITRTVRHEDLRLGGEQILQRTLRTFDLARQDRFFLRTYM